MRIFGYRVHMYKTSYREVYHVAENIIQNKILLSYKLFFITHWCTELNDQGPILLKADQICRLDINNEKVF